VKLILPAQPILPLRDPAYPVLLALQQKLLRLMRMPAYPVLSFAWLMFMPTDPLFFGHGHVYFGIENSSLVYFIKHDND